MNVCISRITRDACASSGARRGRPRRGAGAVGRLTRGAHHRLLLARRAAARAHAVPVRRTDQPAVRDMVSAASLYFLLKKCKRNR